ncbi:MAG TPA: hypothetical protein DDZ67_10830, partial [Xanthomonadaceae bacterium]|nr:hypothetical protein [Xanthomonadaceae bacterium]
MSSPAVTLEPGSAAEPAPVPRTVVHKFGGTSVADAERYRHVARLLLAREETLQVTVVSAMKGVTDALIELAELAAGNRDEWRERWHETRARHRGAAVALDPAAAAAVQRSAQAVEAIVARGEPVYGINTGFGKLATVRIEREDLETLQRNIVLSHAAGVGEPMPVAVVRLMLALKLVSLAQGASGVKPATLALLEAMLRQDLVPVVPCQGSVGASGDLAPLSHMAAVMIGTGEAFLRGERMPAGQALSRAGLQPLVLGAKEGLALLNGTQYSTAYALAALFEIETVFQAALVAGALSTEAAKGSDTPFDPRIHALRGQPGQIVVADALRGLMAGSAIRESHRENDVRVQDPYCLRCQPQVMGA